MKKAFIYFFNLGAPSNRDLLYLTTSSFISRNISPLLLQPRVASLLLRTNPNELSFSEWIDKCVNLLSFSLSSSFRAFCTFNWVNLWFHASWSLLFFIAIDFHSLLCRKHFSFGLFASSLSLLLFFVFNPLIKFCATTPMKTYYARRTVESDKKWGKEKFTKNMRWKYNLSRYFLTLKINKLLNKTNSGSEKKFI